MPIDLQKPRVLFPWLRFLSISHKPVGHDEDHEGDQKGRPGDGHYGQDDDNDIEAQVTTNSFARDQEQYDSDSSSTSQQDHSLSDTCNHSQGDSSLSSFASAEEAWPMTGSLTIRRCRFNDSLHSSNSDNSPFWSTDMTPKALEISHCENERFATTSSSDEVSSKANILYRNQNQNQDCCLHPVTKILRKQELAKQILGLAIPMTMGLMAYYNTMAMTLAARLAFVLLSIGFVALWNGNLLHETYPGISHKIELLGYACVLTAFYTLVAYFLKHTYLALLPIICLILSLVPLGMAFYNRRSVSGN
ncbi:hypothetical protein FNV43_RR26751 [Rhamnella rubrinervis]|uniref:Uncharacterized protein n=1 Tax=Rhamnella rubrinervis TaxID=2594499 RepID=A0A8K0GJY1_9ROSA|nr:hypothetical protein FNV43_RR26751 [Rhamnella rubrinervis]